MFGFLSNTEPLESSLEDRIWLPGTSSLVCDFVYECPMLRPILHSGNIRRTFLSLFVGTSAHRLRSSFRSLEVSTHLVQCLSKFWSLIRHGRISPRKRHYKSLNLALYYLLMTSRPQMLASFLKTPGREPVGPVTKILTSCPKLFAWCTSLLHSTVILTQCPLQILKNTPAMKVSVSFLHFLVCWG